jgi:hypothetical protein
VNRDNHLIYEGYRQKRHLTPNESLQRDKEFFNYVIESNSHLSSLKKFSTKKLFSSYVKTLTDRINNETPGLISESNMSDAQAFSILNEATQTVTDQEAYYSVKDIFEEIAFNNLITKADLFLEMMANPAQGAGDPNELMKRQMARRPGQRDAQGRMLPGQGAAQVQNQAQRDRAAQQIKGLRSANRAATAQNQAKRDRTAQRMQGLRSANQEAAARIAELEARIKEMEAAEANMNQQQKAQSDSIQDQLADMIKQIQNTNTNTMTGPTINIGGGYGAPQAAPQAAQAAPQAAQTAPKATQKAAQSSTPAAKKAQPAPASGQSTPPKPGIFSKIGSGIKKALPGIATVGGAALGSALGGPVGTALGGALGRGLGRFISPKDPKASFGQRLKDAGKSALAGGAMGLAGQAAGEMIGGGGADTGDMYMPADNASSALMNPGDDVAADPGPYADTNPSQPYTPGAGDSGNMLPGYQDDAVNSTGMPDEYAQPGDQGAEAQDTGNPYGAEAGTGLPTDGSETQEGDDEPAKRKYRSVDNTKGATRLMRGR